MSVYCSLLKIHMPTEEDFCFLETLSKSLPEKSYTIENDCSLFFSCSEEDCQIFKHKIVESVNLYFQTDIKVTDVKKTFGSGRFTFTS